MTHPPEIRARAMKLLAGGMSKVEIGRLLGIRADTVRTWEKSPAPRTRRLPVRLRIERRALGDRLVLVRGTAVLAVLGVCRAGGWIVSLDGAMHARSLYAVLPVLVARARDAVLPFAEAAAELPGRPTPRTATGT